MNDQSAKSYGEVLDDMDHQAKYQSATLASPTFTGSLRMIPTDEMVKVAARAFRELCDGDELHGKSFEFQADIIARCVLDAALNPKPKP